MHASSLLETVRRYNAWDARCPSRQVLDLIADKWTTLVLVALAEEPKRYSQLRRDINGISHKMLSQTLRGLGAQRFVVRTVYPSVPPQVDYALTPLAETLIPTLFSLIEWAESHAADLQAIPNVSTTPALSEVSIVE